MAKREVSRKETAAVDVNDVDGKDSAAQAETETERPDFERSLGELETLVEKLEAGELSLEASLELYERGVVLSRACQKALEQAEQRVEMLAAESSDVSQ